MLIYEYRVVLPMKVEEVWLIEFSLLLSLYQYYSCSHSMIRHDEILCVGTEYGACRVQKAARLNDTVLWQQN
ncbi:Hypothetical predicted protein [Octopus vulgaris]|uniref:Uncharacterized protein n=1 Tax=Octopus vulgaris TaxID=6645 RepID=A0AA36AWN4_OCTVU|nr:Hypothetical predicted protein [Octopus vulgaris]